MGPGAAEAGQAAGAPRPRPRNETSRTQDTDTPRCTKHITPKLTGQTRERHKLILARFSIPALIDTHLTRHLLNPPSSTPAIRPRRSSRDSHVPRSPCGLTGRPRNNRIRVFRPARFRGHPGLSRLSGHFPGPQLSPYTSAAALL